MLSQKLYTFHVPIYDANTIKKCQPLSTKVKNKNFVFGFHNHHHTSYVKHNVNIISPRIQIYSRNPENITPHIKTLVFGKDDLYYPSTYMDSICYMDFYKRDPEENIPREAFSIPIEEIDAHHYIDSLHQGLGLAFPYECTDETKQKIRFRGQIIYNIVKI